MCFNFFFLYDWFVIGYHFVYFTLTATTTDTTHHRVTIVVLSNVHGWGYLLCGIETRQCWSNAHPVKISKNRTSVTQIHKYKYIMQCIRSFNLFRNFFFLNSYLRLIKRIRSIIIFHAMRVYLRYLNIEHSWIFPAHYISSFCYTIRTNGTNPFVRFGAYKYSNQNVLQIVY